MKQEMLKRLLYKIRVRIQFEPGREKLVYKLDKEIHFLFMFYSFIVHNSNEQFRLIQQKYE